MKIFITGSSGDLGRVLDRNLSRRGDVPIGVDVRPPATSPHGKFIQGSILDRELLHHAMRGCDCVVHIAAWHGIHLVRGQKNVYDFWDLNVTGTFNAFQAAVDLGIQKFVYISSTTALDRYGVYGHTKVLGEEIAQVYHKRHSMDVIILRPTAFIPYWNHAVYPTFTDYANRYLLGAAHIHDVEQAVIKSLDLLSAGSLDLCPALFVDGKYEYTAADLDSWDVAGPGSTFQKVYGPFAEVARQYGLDISQKPAVFDIEPTRVFLGYEPTYSPLNLLQDLEKYGEAGPPEPRF